jgi:hypothetical protein
MAWRLVECEERERLQREYKANVRRFQQSPVRMQELISDTMIQPIYDAHAESERIRQQCRAAREAIGVHRREHGC